MIFVYQTLDFFPKTLQKILLRISNTVFKENNGVCTVNQLIYISRTEQNQTVIQLHMDIIVPKCNIMSQW